MVFDCDKTLLFLSLREDKRQCAQERALFLNAPWFVSRPYTHMSGAGLECLFPYFNFAYTVSKQIELQRYPGE